MVVMSNEYRFIEHSFMHSKDNPIINHLTGIGFEVYSFVSGKYISIGDIGLVVSGEFNGVKIDIDLSFFDEKFSCVRASNGMQFHGEIDSATRMEEVLNVITKLK